MAARGWQRRFMVARALLPAVVLLLAAAAPADAWPGLNGRISFSSDRAPENVSGDLFATAADGSDVRRLTADRGDDAQSSWSPDGRAIAFKATRFGSNQLARMAWDGSAQELLMRTFRFSEGQPAWSPDAPTLLYRRTPENPLVQDGDVWLLDPAATTDLTAPATRQVLVRPGDERYPSFSPDGREIAFRGDLDLVANSGDEELYVAAADGSYVVQLTADATPDSAPAWSPDGTRIAFESARDSAVPELRDIYVMDADGTDVRRLTDHPALDEGPAWSPDGRQIAFTSERDGNSEIYLMDADGKGQRNLTNDPAKDESPDWQAVPSGLTGARACGDIGLGPGEAASVVVVAAPCRHALRLAERWARRAARGQPTTPLGAWSCAPPAAHSFDQLAVRCEHRRRPAALAFVVRVPA